MYYGEFASKEDVCKEFEIDDIEGTVLFAAYDLDGYEGSAVVLFVRDGKFYFVSGSHCSCYGLEGQWAPEEMELEALRHIIRKGGYVPNAYKPQLEATLRVVEELMPEGAPELHIEIAVRLAFTG